jgi:hypothetical protein
MEHPAEVIRIHRPEEHRWIAIHAREGGFPLRDEPVVHAAARNRLDRRLRELETLELMLANGRLIDQVRIVPEDQNRPRKGQGLSQSIPHFDDPLVSFSESGYVIDLTQGPA